MLGIESTTRDLDRHEFQNYRPVRHARLDCSSCRAGLLGVLTVKETPAVTKLRVECPFCPPGRGGRRERSFPAVVAGKFLIETLPGGRVRHVDSVELDDLAAGETASYLLQTEAVK